MKFKLHIINSECNIKGNLPTALFCLFPRLMHLSTHLHFTFNILYIYYIYKYMQFSTVCI